MLTVNEAAYKIRKFLINKVLRTKNLGFLQKPVEDFMLNATYYNVVRPAKYGLRGYIAVRNQFDYGEKSELNYEFKI